MTFSINVRAHIYCYQSSRHYHFYVISCLSEQHLFSEKHALYWQEIKFYLMFMINILKILLAHYYPFPQIFSVVQILTKSKRNGFAELIDADVQTLKQIACLIYCVIP